MVDVLMEYYVTSYGYKCVQSEISLSIDSRLHKELTERRNYREKKLYLSSAISHFHLSCIYKYKYS